MDMLDLLKRAVSAEFTNTITLDGLLLSLVSAFAIALFIVFIYKKTFSGVAYSKSFALLIVMVAMVTAIVIRTISSNLALSLGMVGALSIVRFRTAVKDPIDTGFIFWSIASGIMTGVGVYIIALITSFALGTLFFISYLFGFSSGGKYLLILRYRPDVGNEVAEVLKGAPKHQLRSKQIQQTRVDCTYDIDYSEKKDRWLERLKSIEGVESVSVVSYHQDFGS